MKNNKTRFSMGKYKKCPRCELNWIASEEELCEVCKAELGKASKISLLEDDEELDMEERICPICKVNYLEPDEDICAVCRQEQADKERGKDEDEWQDDFVDDEVIDDDGAEVSLNQLQEDEEEEFENVDEEEESVDDFEDDFVDVEDGYDDFDEDEEEEDEDFDD